MYCVHNLVVEHRIDQYLHGVVAYASMEGTEFGCWRIGTTFRADERLRPALLGIGVWVVKGSLGASVMYARDMQDPVIRAIKKRPPCD